MYRLQAPPELLHGFGHLRHQRASDAQRKIEAGRGQAAQRHIVLVINDVDAAAESHRAVDHTQLAVQPTPVVRYQDAKAPHGRVHPKPHTRLGKALLPFGWHGARAYPVHHQPHPNAPVRGAFQRLGHAQRLTGKFENIGFQMDHRARHVHRRHQRREQSHAAFEQQQLVTALHAARPGLARGGRGALHYSSNSAISGRWSDMRVQMRPCGTWAFSGRRPRT